MKAHNTIILITHTIINNTHMNIFIDYRKGYLQNMSYLKTNNWESYPVKSEMRQDVVMQKGPINE